MHTSVRYQHRRLRSGPRDGPRGSKPDISAILLYLDHSTKKRNTNPRPSFNSKLLPVRVWRRNSIVISAVRWRWRWGRRSCVVGRSGLLLVGAGHRVACLLVILCVRSTWSALFWRKQDGGFEALPAHLVVIGHVLLIGRRIRVVSRVIRSWSSRLLLLLCGKERQDTQVSNRTERSENEEGI